MKKILILVLFLCCLIGCNSKTKEETPEKETNAVTPTPTPTEPQIITFDERIESIENLGFVTGPESINGELLLESGVHGTDLGINFEFDGKTIFLYGDTFSGKDRNGFWNSNFIAVSSDKDFSDGVSFDEVIARENGMVLPFAQGNHDEDNADDKTKEVTKIPTGAVTIGDTVYLYYMSVRYWGGSTGWLVTFNQCLKSTDLYNWEEVPGVRWNDEEAYNFGQIYPMDDPNSNYIYLYAIPGGRKGGLVCARVLETQIEDINEYEYQVSNNTWVKGASGLAMLKENPYFVAGPQVAEPCVNYNHYLGKYMLTHNVGGTAMYLSDTPYGPFDDKILLYPNNFHSTYGVFTSPNLMEDNGKVFYISVSNWGVYNTYLYKIVLK